MSDITNLFIDRIYAVVKHPTIPNFFQKSNTSSIYTNNMNEVYPLVLLGARVEELAGKIGEVR